jgi:shikimate kinase
MSPLLPGKTLLLLTGPVGVGKSSTAQAAARLLRAQGVGTACVDLDQLYVMARQEEGFGSAATWQLARQSALLLAEKFLQTQADVVIVEGGLLAPGDLLDLQAASGIRCCFVSLHASFDTVSSRVMADTDPGRVASKQPAILRALHDEYEAALPFLRERSVCIDADARPTEAVADELVAVMLRP